MKGQPGLAQVGTAKVVTTQNTGLTVDYWTDRLLDRIIYVGTDFPSPIQEQALAYKAQIRFVIRHFLVNAIKSDRTTLYNLFTQQGHGDMAEILRHLKEIK